MKHTDMHKLNFSELCRLYLLMSSTNLVVEECTEIFFILGLLSPTRYLCAYL